MFLVDWFWGMLSYLDDVESCGLGHKSAKLLFLGLDNAGKTTLLQMLKDNRVATHQPTIHPNSEELVIGKVRFTTYDLGGHEPARRIWSDYFAKCDGVIFMVDASAPERFPDARKELDKLLENDYLQHVPFVVLGNKIDLGTAASEGQLRTALGLTQTTGKEAKGDKESHARIIEVFMCSVTSRMGYAEGFQWLSRFL